MMASNDTGKTPVLHPKVNPATRVILLIGGLIIPVCYFLPLWTIRLWAPQYPEGLAIHIWYNTLKGDVDIVNGLNHYIGMKHLRAEMFPEFNFLGFLIAAYMLLTLFVAWLGTYQWFRIYFIVIVISGVIAMADFYQWEYNYGHQLDPDAPIKVPGMAYQPPFLGYKSLLNFTALSIPAAGGWIVLAIAATTFILFIIETIRIRKQKLVIPFFMLLYFTIWNGLTAG